jgi:hypothetical protein
MAEVEQRMMEILFQNIQQSRVLWQVVKKVGGTITIDESDVNPLFELKMSRPEGKPTEMILTAGLLPQMTAEQIEKMVEALLGTANDPGPAMDKNGLGAYPKSYVIGQLQPIIVFDGKMWVKRSDFDEQQKTKQPPPA